MEDISLLDTSSKPTADSEDRRAAELLLIPLDPNESNRLQVEHSQPFEQLLLSPDASLRHLVVGP